MILLRSSAGLLLATAVAACIPSGPVLPVGARQVVIPVENLGAAPAILEVTNDNPQRRVLVGSASPSSIAPGVIQDVVFTLPGDGQWAIEVNRQTLIVAPDLAGRSGRLPISIHVDPAGNSSWAAPNDWFGP